MESARPPYAAASASPMEKVAGKRRRLLFADLLFWLILLLTAGLCQAAPPPEEEQRGADVFVTSKAALLRETAGPAGKVVARLPYATRLTLLEGADAYLHVEVPSDSPAVAAGGMRIGFLASEATAVFDPGAAGTADMVTVGRTLARNSSLRLLGTALLARGVERLRQAATPDPRAELALAEAATALAAEGGPFPAGVAVVERGKGADGKPRFLYTGDSYQRALDLTAKQDPKAVAFLRERALAGLLRSRYPQRSETLTTLWQETAGWLELTETAQTPSVLRGSAERLGGAALALGRYLVAAGKLDDLSKVAQRAQAASRRVTAILPDSRDGARLAARAEILQAMRGDGTRSFPQEGRLTVGGRQIAVRIDGEIGKLKLLVQTSDKQRTTPFLLRTAVPILPVPGSLRVSPDGRSAAWVELSGPSALLPVMASLEKEEPAREIAFLSTGRPLRDRSLAHVVSTVTGFSSDSRRLGLSILAWDETPGPAPRLSVVSAETGELLFETSKDNKQFRRMLQ